jgi:hypothetical protein
MPTAQFDSPVTLVEGIGAATARRLEDSGIFTVFDLLRAGAEDIHAAVHEVASLAQTLRWRAAAALLQVNGMTNQWAEALVAGGVDSIEQLHSATHAELRQALDAARAAGSIPDVPDDATLHALRVDAAVLQFTGAVNVTVRDDVDLPVAGAAVKVGALRGTTDARGRARIARIPLGRSARLVVEKTGFMTETLDLERPLLDESQVAVEVVQLVSAGAVAGATVHLSEYDGDLLPPLSVGAMTTEARAAGALRDRDILMLRRFYEDGTTAQLTSKYLEYRDGTWVAVSFRVPRSQLPSGAAVRQHFIYRRGRFDAIAMNATRLDLFKAMRRARAAGAGRPPAETIAEMDARMREHAELIVAHRLWAPRGGQEGAP